MINLKYVSAIQAIVQEGSVTAASKKLIIMMNRLMSICQSEILACPFRHAGRGLGLHRPVAV